MGEFLNVVNFQEGLRKLREACPKQETELLPIRNAYRKTIASKFVSPENLPAFNRTTVDGYAVYAPDTYGCSETLPAFLQFDGEVQMGQAAECEITPGHCCWIPTGGMLPSGSNAAVMVEYTEKMGEDTILIYKPVAPWENIMQTGEDVQTGQELFLPGKAIRAQDIGLLASLGVEYVPVNKPYRVGIISTGDEIVPLNIKPLPGQVRDVNSYALAVAVEACGHIANVYPLVKDDRQELTRTIDKGLNENDILLLSGGSSVGLKDMSLEVLMSFPDATMLFHGLAVKPGKPCLGVKIGHKLAVGLPGHPVSALMMFHIICKPLLQSCAEMVRDVSLELNVASQAGRDDFIPVQIIEGEDLPTARPLLGKSGLMSILALADGYIHIAYEKQGLKAGEKVKAYLF
ncbi:molybdopterin molybdotransferase MoeA [Syntrophomonas palmitatica]|uniref:molybdopterin molybdotransferase MoeA n=1 Tax=Syntrophomonas palmitatica TaxID=402877 RepID=UPI0006CFF3E8|nr:molybdopterin molybdotransferase MoeA [Syntrophomonas palmitatica]